MTKKQAENFHDISVEKEWQMAKARALSTERRLQIATKRIGAVLESMNTDGLRTCMKTDPRRSGRIL